MKHLNDFLILPLLVLLLTASSCKKDKIAPLDKLPEATQQGKGTFGCLVNGEAFTPKGSLFGGPVKNCYYQYIDGNYYFHVSASRDIDEGLFDVNINTNALPISKDAVILLGQEKASGVYSVYKLASKDNRYRTNDNYKGELTITHLDEINQIVSGTFWFDAVNNEGEKVEVREGRFDMLYSK